MTFYWGREIPGWVIFGCIVFVGLLKIFYPEDHNSRGDYISQTVVGPAYESPLHDSLPHYRYRQIEDSLKRLEVENDFFLQNGGESSFSFLGLASYGKENKQEKFFTVEGYAIEDFASVKNELSGSILHYPVWDKTNNDRRNGDLKSIAVGIKYKDGKERWQGKVYAPINSTVYTILQFLMYGLGALIFVFALYAVFYIPLRFLLRLSKGQAFNDENIGSLYLTGWTMIGLALFVTIVNIIGHLFIQSQIPAAISFSYYTAFMKTSNLLVAGLAVLLLAKAFLQGLELREEQDLTI